MKRIKIAVPRKGRLHAPILKMLEKAKYIANYNEKSLHYSSPNEAIDFIFLRTDDIPILVEQGKIDLGITGKDIVIETKVKLKELFSLEIGKCRLVLAGSKSTSFKNLAQLNGKKIATSFPNITKKFFQKKGVAIECLSLSGSIEVMLKLDVCHAVVDLVETGNTLRENNLVEWEILGNYSVGLFAKNNLNDNLVTRSFLKRLKGITIANHYSILEYNIKKSLLKAAEEITPGLDAPTISHLDDPRMVAIKVMIKKSQVISTMDKLEKIGASGIFEIEIANCRL